ncbi:hypothetical protein Pla108_28370 [Botrimarina colliarenosi]|uniref:Peptidase S54 rhomboid domain-containing protein n=1 Tax=Botrimarina colliarenosi TaxID=2528001 RepID=A0A5C6ACB3_9BACT|nr:hypothetical protein [Botrimarina colliarenosi]TWT97060.1 hypothetical protein Pla108_28370 [Botrimarina colliarenosi]
MDLLTKLERRFRHLAVPHLVTAIVIGQVIVYTLAYLQRVQGLPGINIDAIVRLRPDLILQGEVWRLVTFLFEPPRTWFVWMLLYWYAMWFIGLALERTWGAFRLTLYLFIGYAATVGVSFFLPAGFEATNAYLYSSLFLAFARIYPDFVFYIYFVLPVKVKWLAALTWVYFALDIAAGGWPVFWLVLATVADFLLFFGVDIFARVKDAKRKQDFRLKVASGTKPIVHECRTCGLTSAMAPRTAFRYCSQCAGQCCYCPDHLRNHEHVVEAKPE